MSGILTIPKEPLLFQMNANDCDAAVAHLTEQLRCQELTFFEEATAIADLISQYGMTQEDAAAKLGKAQSTIANKLRLLRLTPQEQQRILQNNLTERHARALLRLRAAEERMQVLDKVIQYRLNVEKTETAVEEIIGQTSHPAGHRKQNRFLRNIRSFMNTVNRAIENIQAAGIPADTEKVRNGDHIEYRIRISVASGSGEQPSGESVNT